MYDKHLENEKEGLEQWTVKFRPISHLILNSLTESFIEYNQALQVSKFCKKNVVYVHTSNNFSFYCITFIDFHHVYSKYIYIYLFIYLEADLNYKMLFCDFFQIGYLQLDICCNIGQTRNKIN